MIQSTLVPIFFHYDYLRTIGIFAQNHKVEYDLMALANTQYIECWDVIRHETGTYRSLRSRFAYMRHSPTKSTCSTDISAG